MNRVSDNLAKKKQRQNSNSKGSKFDQGWLHKVQGELNGKQLTCLMGVE